MKFAYIDTETTGTDASRHAIHQVALILDIDGTVMIEKQWKMCPFKEDEIDDAALLISNTTRAELATFPHALDVHEAFIDVLSMFVDKYDRRDKYFFVGYNSPFDSDFVRAWFKKCRDEYFGSWFWWPDICVARALCIKHHLDRPNIKNFKLSTVAQFFGLGNGVDWHDALADARTTRELFRRC